VTHSTELSTILLRIGDPWRWTDVWHIKGEDRWTQRSVSYLCLRVVCL